MAFRPRLDLGAAAVAAVCLLGASACSSSSKPAVTMPTTTLPGNAGTAGGASLSGGGPSPMAKADAVCAQIVRIERSTGSYQLTAPHPGQNEAATISVDMSQLRNAVRGLAGGSQGSSSGGSWGPMVASAGQAVTQGQAAATSLEAGQLEVGRGKWDKALQDLQKARAAGAAEHLQSCA